MERRWVLLSWRARGEFTTAFTRLSYAKIKLTLTRDEALKQTRILEEKIRMLVGGLGLPAQ